MGVAYVESHSPECRLRGVHLWHVPNDLRERFDGVENPARGLLPSCVDVLRLEHDVEAQTLALQGPPTRGMCLLLQEGLTGRAWLDPAGDRWEATLVGSGNMEGWTLFVRASAPVRPNKTEWKRGPDATWKELS